VLLDAVTAYTNGCQSVAVERNAPIRLFKGNLGITQRRLNAAT